MAARFWVAGTGSFSDNTNHWSATSGGAPNASKPGVSDDTTWDAASGGGTCTFDEAVSVISITCGAFTGTINTNGRAVAVTGAFSITGTGVRTLTLGASAITQTGATAKWDSGVTTNLTFNAGTSSIVLTSGYTSSTNTFLSEALTFYDVTIYVQSGVSTAASPANSTFHNLTISQLGNTSTFFMSPSTITVNGVLTATGVSATARLQWLSDNSGSARLIVCNGSAVVSNVNFSDMTVSGTAAPISGTSIGDQGRNSGITCTPAATRYWVHDGTASYNFFNGGRWSATSGGAVGASDPLPQDLARFDALSFPATGKTVVLTWAGNNAPSLPAMDFTGATNSPTISQPVTRSNLFGSLTLISAMTWSIVSRVDILGRGDTITITSAGKSFSSTNGVIVIVVGGVCTLADAFNSGLTLTHTHGALTAASDVTMTAFSSSVTTTRALNMGPGTWLLTGTGTVWNMATTTGLTLTPGTSTIKVNDASATAKTFSGGGKTYNDIWLAGAGTGTFDFVGANTFRMLRATEPPHTLRFTAGTTTTVSSFAVNGTSGNLMTLSGITAATWTIALGAARPAYLSITNSTVSPATVTTNSTNGGSNSGWTFSALPTGAVGAGVATGVVSYEDSYAVVS